MKSKRMNLWIRRGKSGKWIMAASAISNRQFISARKMLSYCVPRHGLNAIRKNDDWMILSHGKDPERGEMNRLIKFLSSFDISHSTYKYASTTAQVFSSRRFNFLFTPWNRRVKNICDSSLVDIDGENLIIKLKEEK